jgi:V-type H+-transporting ATPase subunit H
MDKMKYILTLLADITEDINTTILLARDNSGGELIPLLLNILGRHDGYCQHQACLCAARLATYSANPLAGDELNQLLGWIIAQSKHNNEYLECITKALMSFLRRPSYRLPFYESHGVKPILDLLDHRLTFQLQYEIIFSLWMLSFEANIVNRMKEYPVAAVLSDVLKGANRPKVQRIILATFRNLLDKAVPDTADKFAAEMIHFKALQVLSVLESKSLDDDDFEEDVKFLQEKLTLSLQDLSSFDEYAAEIKSRRLEWSPVHKSDKFWRENVLRLNENDYYLLRLLVGILHESQNPVAMAVASHDLGEYVRYYPRGKNVIEHLGAKELIMNLVNHANTEVRMQALLSVQKMMVQNWEYLGKQLETKA